MKPQALLPGEFLDPRGASIIRKVPYSFGDPKGGQFPHLIRDYKL